MPLEETGRAAFDLLLRSIEGQPMLEKTPLLPVEPIIRSSCGAPAPPDKRVRQ